MFNDGCDWVIATIVRKPGHTNTWILSDRWIAEVVALVDRSYALPDQRLLGTFSVIRGDRLEAGINSLVRVFDSSYDIYRTALNNCKLCGWHSEGETKVSILWNFSVTLRDNTRVNAQLAKRTLWAGQYMKVTFASTMIKKQYQLIHLILSQWFTLDI